MGAVGEEPSPAVVYAKGKKSMQAIPVTDEMRRIMGGAVNRFCFADLDDAGRWRLLEGLDDIGLTLRHVDDIAAYEMTRRVWLPTLK